MESITLSAGPEFSSHLQNPNIRYREVREKTNKMQQLDVYF